MQILGIGIIGFGFMGKVHAYNYRSVPFYYEPVPVRTKLIGVANPDPDPAMRLQAEQAGFDFFTANWRDLISRDDIHIIDICSPNSQHAEQLLAAIAAGKHIYCDKPLTVGDENLDRVEAALRNFRATGQMALQYRFFPATLRAKQLMESGFVGNVISFRAAYLHSGSVDRDKPMGWKQLKSEGGGVLQDLGSHIMDLMTHLVGPFASVFAQTHILYPQRPNRQGEWVPVQTDDMVVMMAKLQNGAIGTIEASKIATGAEDEVRFEIHGDQGLCASIAWIPIIWKLTIEELLICRSVASEGGAKSPASSASTTPGASQARNSVLGGFAPIFTASIISSTLSRAADKRSPHCKTDCTYSVSCLEQKDLQLRKPGNP